VPRRPPRPWDASPRSPAVRRRRIHRTGIPAKAADPRPIALKHRLRVAPRSAPRQAALTRWDTRRRARTLPGVRPADRLSGVHVGTVIQQGLHGPPRFPAAAANISAVAPFAGSHRRIGGRSKSGAHDVRHLPDRAKQQRRVAIDPRRGSHVSHPAGGMRPRSVSVLEPPSAARSCVALCGIDIGGLLNQRRQPPAGRPPAASATRLESVAARSHAARHNAPSIAAAANALTQLRRTIIPYTTGGRPAPRSR